MERQQAVRHTQVQRQNYPPASSKARFPVALLLLAILLPLSETTTWGEEPADAPAINDSPLTSTTDLLRGYSENELARIQQLIPQRPEPPLPEAVPRIAMIRGNVFLDSNRNGQQDEGEKGLADITVSDGQRVDTTDSNGSFEFVIRFDDQPHHRFVMVTRPNGYKPTTSHFRRIAFHERETTYTASFGFLADPESAKPNFWFMAASDSQFTSPHQMLPIAKDYAQITSAPGKPAFLVTAGDLTMNGSQYEWDMYDYIRRSSKIPVYEGFGGHDGNCLDPRCTVSFEQRIGPPYYSWNYGGVHFIQLVTETGYLRNLAQVRHREWIEADLGSLAPGTPVIAVSHYPLSASWFDQRRQNGINVICQIGAHYHVVMAGRRNGVPVLNSAPARGHDWGAYSRTYRWVHVSPQGISSQLRVLGQYKRLKLLAPGTNARQVAQPVVVLAYDSALQVETMQCHWTGPAGQAIDSELVRKGDWSWHGSVSFPATGSWSCQLEVLDDSGQKWQRTETIKVTDALPAIPREGSDHAWLLAGNRVASRNQTPDLPLTPLWVTHTGSTHVLHNSPVLAEGRIFVSVGNPNAGSPGAGVLCLDAMTGAEVWKTESVHGDVRSAPTVHDGYCYLLTAEGWAEAYELATGTLKWSTQVNSQYLEGRPLAINNTPPIPTPHGLIVSEWGAAQHLLDYQTGKKIASLNTGVGSYSSFSSYHDNTLFTVYRGTGMALSVPAGDVIWKVEESSRSTSAPLVAADRLIYTASAGVTVRNRSTGDIIWRKPFGNAGYQNPIPVVWDDQLLVNGTDFRSLDLQTGETRWQVNCGREADRFIRSRRQALAGSSTPIVSGDLAFFGHDDTSIRAVRRSGEVAWEYRLGTPIKTAPVLSGNRLYVHDFAGNLWCFASTAASAAE